MGRTLFVIAVLALSLVIGKCGKTPEDDITGIDDPGGKNYPNNVEEPNDVYYGPDYYEDNNGEKYPNGADDTAPVYYGPDYKENDD